MLNFFQYPEIIQNLKVVKTAMNQLIEELSMWDYHSPDLKDVWNTSDKTTSSNNTKKKYKSSTRSPTKKIVTSISNDTDDGTMASI